MKPEDRLRRIRGDARLAALKIGAKRIEQERKCAVPNCTHKTKTYSAYCRIHKEALANNGHPTLKLALNTISERESFRKIGRFVLAEVLKTDSDRAAWGRVLAGIAKARGSHTDKFDVVTMWRRKQHWTREAKARAYLASAIPATTGNLIDDRERLEWAVGMTAWLLLANEIPFSRRQIDASIRKLFGRALLIMQRYPAGEGVEEGKYKVKPTTGVLTAAGKIATDLIGREFGRTFWKNVDGVAAIHLSKRLDHDLARVAMSPRRVGLGVKGLDTKGLSGEVEDAA